MAPEYSVLALPSSPSLITPVSRSVNHRAVGWTLCQQNLGPVVYFILLSDKSEKGTERSAKEATLEQLSTDIKLVHFLREELITCMWLKSQRTNLNHVILHCKSSTL